MKQLTPAELEINGIGSLTSDQLRIIKGKGVINAIAGFCFLVLIPLGYFASNLRSITMLIIFTIGGGLFAAAFFWSAWGYLFMKPDGHNIIPISGKASMKNSGNKNVVLKIGDRSFFLRKTDVKDIRDGEDYTIYYIEEQRIPIGWIKNTTD